MPKLTLLVGPPGSGKSTWAKSLIYDDSDHGLATAYINQDLQGSDHLFLFECALNNGKNIVVDRMNFNKAQRSRYLDLACASNYETEIVVLHQPYQVCYERVIARENHPTIKDEKSARGALHTFFTKYERVQDDEADIVTRVWPEGAKEPAVLCDLDGTLCNIEHRLHFVRGEGKRDWRSFFESLRTDKLNTWCADILDRFSDTHPIVYCSGRTSDYRDLTVDWLKEKGVFFGDHLYMRMGNDFRPDDVVKEIILDFEILTRFKPYFVIDDRKRVVDMWRRRGITCLQCADGEF